MKHIAEAVALAALFLSLAYCGVNEDNIKAAYRLECLKMGKAIDWHGDCK